ncbi:MAG: hypothetical protein KAJ19_28110, partial [Gammaproteobacteria bacterium]|nr:hypothetical protein [Gammaproteobacteria bacterium]
MSAVQQHKLIDTFDKFHQFNDEGRMEAIGVVDFKALNMLRSHITDASYQVAAEEVEEIEKQILHTLRHTLVTPHFVNTKNIGKGILTHTYWQWNDVQAPRLSRDPGTRGDVVGVTKAKTQVEMYSFDYDMHISMMQVDAHQNSNRFLSFSESL